MCLCQGYWQVTGDTIGINGKEIVNAFSAILDTGTTLILGDTSYVRQLYAVINATEVGGGVYSRRHFDSFIVVFV